MAEFSLNFKKHLMASTGKKLEASNAPTPMSNCHRVVRLSKQQLSNEAENTKKRQELGLVGWVVIVPFSHFLNLERSQISNLKDTIPGD